MPLGAFMSSVTGLLTLEQLVVYRKTWEETDERLINKKRAAQGVYACLGQAYASKTYTKTLLVNVLLILIYSHGGY